MPNDPRAPTRTELSRAFNGDPRMIRAFEKIFDLLPEDLTSLDERITIVERRSKTNQVLLWLSM